VAHLLHELEVEGMTRGRIDTEYHVNNCTTVLVQRVNRDCVSGSVNSQS
jgi:hypothetical protein